MKKLSRLLVVLVIVSAIFACKKDDKTEPEIPGLGGAKCVVKIDGTTVIDATSKKAGRDAETGSGDNIAILELNDGSSLSVTGIPLTVGKTATIDGFDIGLAAINVIFKGEKKTLYTKTGTITRTADDKVEFTGKTKDDKHTITGYVKSDLIKQIK